ncbi:Uncharacterised protein [Chromobacterium violaceum]|uniref:Uncharacterized protein n=1 Tax=Chromobacterium violaceum TaxID=536 RepID=A0A3S4IHN7_CHRVL|nr:Uncharacterised protein [Chromobacterium violaceum]
MHAQDTRAARPIAFAPAFSLKFPRLSTMFYRNLAMQSHKLTQPAAYLRYHDIPGHGVPLIMLHGLGCASSFDYPRLLPNRVSPGAARYWWICWATASATSRKISATPRRPG